MLGAIKTQGALTIYSFSYAINADSLSGAMIINDRQPLGSLLPTTEVSAFVATPGVLVLGCATCNNGRGMVYIFDIK